MISLQRSLVSHSHPGDRIENKPWHYCDMDSNSQIGCQKSEILNRTRAFCGRVLRGVLQTRLEFGASFRDRI